VQIFVSNKKLCLGPDPTVILVRIKTNRETDWQKVQIRYGAGLKIAVTNEKLYLGKSLTLILVRIEANWTVTGFLRYWIKKELVSRCRTKLYLDTGSERKNWVTVGC
jgi:hypothetical protein